MLAGPCWESAEKCSKQQPRFGASPFAESEASNGGYKSSAATCRGYLLITASARLVPVVGHRDSLEKEQK